MFSTMWLVDPAVSPKGAWSVNVVVCCLWDTCCAVGRHNVSCALDKLPHIEEAAEVGKPQIHQCFVMGEKGSADLSGSITNSTWTLCISPNSIFECM